MRESIQKPRKQQAFIKFVGARHTKIETCSIKVHALDARRTEVGTYVITATAIPDFSKRENCDCCTETCEGKRKEEKHGKPTLMRAQKAFRNLIETL